MILQKITPVLQEALDKAEDQFIIDQIRCRAEISGNRYIKEIDFRIFNFQRLSDLQNGFTSKVLWLQQIGRRTRKFHKAMSLPTSIDIYYKNQKPFRIIIPWYMHFTIIVFPLFQYWVYSYNLNRYIKYMEDNNAKDL